MKEFKFACPSCSQHIKIETGFESRRIDCPSCQTSMIVPAPPTSAGPLPVATLASTPARTGAVASPTTRIPPLPRSQPKSASPKTKPPAQSGAGSVTIVAPTNDLRVAVLTAKLKLEIVRKVHSRIADKSRWLPGKKKAGEYNYAARQEGDQLVNVSPTDTSATHLSLFGAVLLEFHRHKVMSVTTGRRRFLDEELTAAIRQVLGRQPGRAPLSEAQREALTHPQCLAVLDILEQRYEREAEQAVKQEEKHKIAHVRLADLVKKLEEGAALKIEEVACALYYELEELNQRLDELEQNTGAPAAT